MPDELLPFWDIEGNVHHFEGFPDSLKDWDRSSSEPLDPETALIVDVLEKSFQSQVTSTSLFAEDGVVRKVTFEASKKEQS